MVTTAGLVLENGTWFLDQLSEGLQADTGDLSWPGWTTVIMALVVFVPKVGTQANVWSKATVAGIAGDAGTDLGDDH